jgi:Carboxypeptidase regulatory-like domain
MRVRCFFLVVVLVLSSYALQAQIPFAAGQVWTGTYTCSQGLTSLNLRIQSVNGNSVNAIFDFNFSNGRCTGQFTMSGIYSASNRRLALNAGNFLPGLNSCDYVTVNIDGNVSNDNRTYSGTVDGRSNTDCTTFSLTSQQININGSLTGKITSPPVSTGSPIANVRVALNTGQSTMTDAQGNYSFSNLPLGAYTITPTLQGYTFAPRDRVETLTAAQPSITTNFEARPVVPATKPSISGNVTLPNGTGVNRVSIEGRLQGGGNRLTSTDSRGFYTITESDAGTYTIVPSLAGYTFTPVNRTVTLSSTNVVSINFTANAIIVQQPTLTLTISPEAEQTVSAGQSVRYTLTVRDGSNQPVADATIAVQDNLQNPNRNLTTNAAGQVEMTITLPVGTAAGANNVVFTATKMGFVASGAVTRVVRVGSVMTMPIQPTLTLTASPEAEQTASVGSTMLYTLTVRDQNNQVVSDALISVEDNIRRQSQTLSTNTAGQVEYSLTVPAATPVGAYNLVFRSTKPNFTASNTLTRTVRVSGLPLLTSISGRVKTPADFGVQGITVRLNTGQDTRTAADGTYNFPNIPIGSYTVSIDVPNSYRLLGAPRQVQIDGPSSRVPKQDFTVVRDAQSDELIKIHVIEKVPGIAKKVELWGKVEYFNDDLNRIQVVLKTS